MKRDFVFPLLLIGLFLFDQSNASYGGLCTVIALSDGYLDLGCMLFLMPLLSIYMIGRLFDMLAQTRLNLNLRGGADAGVPGVLVGNI